MSELLVVIPENMAKQKEVFERVIGNQLSLYTTKPHTAFREAGCIKPSVCFVLYDDSCAIQKALKQLAVGYGFPILAIGNAKYEIKCLEGGANSFLQLLPTLNSERILAHYRALLSLNMEKGSVPVRFAIHEDIIGSFRINHVHRSVTHNGSSWCRLSPKEYRIFLCLAKADGRVVTTNTLLKTVWKDKVSSTKEHTVLVTIDRLRAKLKRLHNVAIGHLKGGYVLDVLSD